MCTLNHHAWTFKIILTRSWWFFFCCFWIWFLSVLLRIFLSFCLGLVSGRKFDRISSFSVLWTSLSSQSVNPSLKSGRAQQWIHLGLSPFLNQVGFVLSATPSILLFVDLFRLLIPSWPSFRISYSPKNYFFLDFSNVMFSNIMFSKYILLIF